MRLRYRPYVSTSSGVTSSVTEVVITTTTKEVEQ